jgi:hypothetical protein
LRYSIDIDIAWHLKVIDGALVFGSLALHNEVVAGVSGIISAFVGGDIEFEL